MNEHPSLIVAHRGESFDAPENTLAAINLAWERGAMAVEIDVHLSRDNQIVVIHDFNTKRLAGVNKNVQSQTLEELKALDVGLWKGEQWKGERVPTVREVLDTIPKGKKLIIEIKSDEKLIPYLHEELELSELSNEQIELIGFDLHTMAYAKEAFPGHRVLWLLDLDYRWINRIFKPSIEKAIKKVKKFHLDGLNVWAGKMLDKSMVRQVQDAGLLLYCWTVDDPDQARNLKSWGIDAITTNRAQWLKSKLGL